MSKFIQIVTLLLFLLTTLRTFGQEPDENWDTPKLMGKRYASPLSYKGPQYLNTEWRPGTIYLSNGDSAVHVFLKYNRHLDELIYYNPHNTSMIRLDKKPISGFTIDDGTRTSRFKKLTINRSPEKAEFYEVLYSGRTEFLAHRGSELVICPSYTSSSGIKKDREFKSLERYLIYDKAKGMLPITLKRRSVFLKFGQSKKKEIRKVLHKKKYQSVTDENSMVQVWKLLEEKGFKPMF